MLIISKLIFILVVASVCVAWSGANDLGKSSRVVGGREARPTEVPYIVSIQRDYGDGNVHYCGGSIYNERFIITAAHCMKNANMAVLAGTVDATKSTVPSAQVIRTKAVTLHSGWTGRGGPLKDDIALVELEQPLTFNAAVQPIPIAPLGLVSSGVATLSGWGRTLFAKLGDDMGDPSKVLRTVKLRVVPKAACDKMYAEIPKKDVYASAHKFEPGESEFGVEVPAATILCAGNFVDGQIATGKSSCLGDSGGPLQCTAKIEGKPLKYLCGIVSYGKGCGTRLPGGYTDVAQYHDWIRQNTAGGEPVNATRHT